LIKRWSHPIAQVAQILYDNSSYFRALSQLLFVMSRQIKKPTLFKGGLKLAGSTGLEPAPSGVTGRRYNQLNYDPIKQT
jgi:hypothetical protein